MNTRTDRQHGVHGSHILSECLSHGHEVTALVCSEDEAIAAM